MKQRPIPRRAERVRPVPHRAERVTVRHVVIFRDPRNVVISEHRMKMSMPDWYHLPQMELDDFIRLRFKVRVLMLLQQ